MIQDPNPRAGARLLSSGSTVKITSQVVLEACPLCFSLFSVQRLTLLGAMLTVGSFRMFELLHTYTHSVGSAHKVPVYGNMFYSSRLVIVSHSRRVYALNPWCGPQPLVAPSSV